MFITDPGSNNNMFFQLLNSVTGVVITGASPTLKVIVSGSGAAPLGTIHEVGVSAPGVYYYALDPSEAAVAGAVTVNNANTLQQLLEFGPLPTTSIATAVGQRVFEGELNYDQAMQILYAALSGKSDGGGTGTRHFRNGDDNKNRITATVDANNNRTGVTLDLD